MRWHGNAEEETCQKELRGGGIRNKCLMDRCQLSTAVKGGNVHVQTVNRSIYIPLRQL